MKPEIPDTSHNRALLRAARYGTQFRSAQRPIHPTADAKELRRNFCVPLKDAARDGAEVIDALIEAAEPGLVGNTHGGFFAWVMGASDPTGVAADWLTSVWGQNAAIYQTSPAAAIAEEAVSAWLLDLLDLPRESSVGLVTGATMAGFVCLAAARYEVLRRAGYDLDRDGLQGAPRIGIFLSDDCHVSNFTVLRYLGFGEANLVRIPSDAQGVMHVDALKQALAAFVGPKIIIGQAGHINSGGFDDFTAITSLAKLHDAWLHVDGAFGLWLRVLPERQAIAKAIENADSWAVDGHKWLQIPYDSGFAIMRDADAHRQTMAMSASYLNLSAQDGRNPSEFNPELSRRARGFAAWAVMQKFGRSGIRKLVRGHCRLARVLGRRLSSIKGISVLNRVDANQVIFTIDAPERDQRERVEATANRLNALGPLFVRTATWKGQACMRVSIISAQTDIRALDMFVDFIETEISQPGR